LPMCCHSSSSIWSSSSDERRDFFTSKNAVRPDSYLRNRVGSQLPGSSWLTNQLCFGNGISHREAVRRWPCWFRSGQELILRTVRIGSGGDLFVQMEDSFSTPLRSAQDDNFVCIGFRNLDAADQTLIVATSNAIIELRGCDPEELCAELHGQPTTSRLTITEVPSCGKRYAISSHD
jgi:hypothetical protein